MLGAADVGAAMNSPRSVDGVGGDDDRFGVDTPSGEVLGGTGGTRSAGSAASSGKPRKRVRFHQAVTNTGEVWPVGPSLYQKQQAAAAGPGSDSSLHGEVPMKTSYLMMQDHMRACCGSRHLAPTCASACHSCFVLCCGCHVGVLSGLQA